MLIFSTCRIQSTVLCWWLDQHSDLSIRPPYIHWSLANDLMKNETVLNELINQKLKNDWLDSIIIFFLVFRFSRPIVLRHFNVPLLVFIQTRIKLEISEKKEKKMRFDFFSNPSSTTKKERKKDVNFFLSFFICKYIWKRFLGFRLYQRSVDMRTEHEPRSLHSCWGCFQINCDLSRFFLPVFKWERTDCVHTQTHTHTQPGQAHVPYTGLMMRNFALPACPPACLYMYFVYCCCTS